MSLSKFKSILLFWLLAAMPAMASGEGGHNELPAYAVPVFKLGPLVVTNSMIMVWIVTIVIIVVAQLATRNMKLVPSGLQNFVEWLVESVYGYLEGLLGPRLVKRTFWFMGTVFIFILFSNWFGLIPGVGTIGKIQADGTFVPFFRGPNADLNMTLAMSMVFAIMWFYWAISEIGIKNFFLHIFGPKSKFKGAALVIMIALFFLVGCIEVISIMFRPVALTFRLYGNIYAGETMLESMMAMVGDHKWLAWLPALPFYFLELLVGFIQALVFMLLSAVFLKLVCEEEGAEEGHPG
jgi:F-type H+-transporting ATPase subunit a